MAARRRRVVWAKAARQALDDVIAHVARDSRTAASRVLNQALEAADTLAFLAERGRVVPEFGDPTVREIFVYSYRLLYEIRNDTVAVIGFVHGARDFNGWWRQGGLEVPLPPLTE
jgi:plasmid stabilization system protein ParE